MSFRIADDSNTDYKALVRDAYDCCAVDYASQRRSAPEQELNLITDRLAAGSAVLDVGCGAGRPVTAHLANTHQVMGIDISSSMIALARDNVAQAQFMTVDVMTADFERGSFDPFIFSVKTGENRGRS